MNRCTRVRCCCVWSSLDKAGKLNTKSMSATEPPGGFAASARATLTHAFCDGSTPKQLHTPHLILMMRAYARRMHEAQVDAT